MGYLDAFVPTAGNPFDRTKARHLMRRAGFDCTPEEADARVAKGLSTSVDELVDFPYDDVDAINLLTQNTTIPNYYNWATLTEAEVGADPANTTFKDFCFFLMLYTQYPLREKMVLFWHNHFVSARTDVGSGYQMIRQLDTWRRNALPTHFRMILIAAAQDPAMLVYLNNYLNRKESPDENWARELMELFTIGVNQFTENDVKEMARVFTGWTRGDVDRKPDEQSYYYYFRTSYHDYGKKMLFDDNEIPETRTGAAGEQDGFDAMEFCLAKTSLEYFPLPAACVFLARKLLRFFVTYNPPLPAVLELAAFMQANDYNIKETVRAILGSQIFFDPAYYRTEVRSPIEFVVALNQLAGTNFAYNFREMYDQARLMSQQFMDPPNVAGWDEGRSWINVNTMLARANFGYRLETNSRAARLDPDALLSSTTLTNGEMVEELLRRFYGDDFRPEIRNLFIQYTDEEDQAPNGRNATAMRHRKVEKLLHLIAALPEMQLK